MAQRPTNAAIASLASLLPYPAMRLLDHLNRGCGDGLCGFFPGLLILGALAATTLLFLVRSTAAGETPMALRLLPVALWMLVTIPMLFL